MKRVFKYLKIGEKFYPIGLDGRIDLRLVLMKISRILLTSSNPEPTESFKVTQNVIEAKMINAAVLTSPDGAQDGYYDFIPDDAAAFTNPRYTC